MTLGGQTAEYWNGRRYSANEANPWFFSLLSSHPAVFAGGTLLWIGIFVSLIVLLPRRWSMILAVAIVLGHTWGAASWLGRFGAAGYWATLGLFLVSAVLLVDSWERSSRDRV